ncbi:MAG: hypothetical protein Q7S92_01065 [Candidatus Diapherotrites archaeon]|nr:hypothetical protein [Candidatus Diapherotrites archaeon]
MERPKVKPVAKFKTSVFGSGKVKSKKVQDWLRWHKHALLNADRFIQAKDFARRAVLNSLRAYADTLKISPQTKEALLLAQDTRLDLMNVLSGCVTRKELNGRKGAFFDSQPFVGFLKKYCAFLDSWHDVFPASRLKNIKDHAIAQLEDAQDSIRTEGITRFLIPKEELEVMQHNIDTASAIFLGFKAKRFLKIRAAIVHAVEQHAQLLKKPLKERS